MAKLLIVLFVGLILEAVGVVYLGKGLKEIGEPPQVNAGEIARLLGRGATNKHILLGIALEAAYFGCLLYLMSQADISFVWPVSALGFVLTALSAHFLLGEYVSPLRWFGVSLIVAGAGVITYTETVKTESRSPTISQSKLESR
ncbi:MAG: hypothetical protein EXS36_16480 [Pedosphaera sp.]|nr:hypothetical protein [Pedosphaera sp.]